MKSTYLIQERLQDGIIFTTIDHLRNKKQAEQVIKEYQSYKPQNEYRIVETN